MVKLTRTGVKKSSTSSRVTTSAAIEGEPGAGPRRLCPRGRRRLRNENYQRGDAAARGQQGRGARGRGRGGAWPVPTRPLLRRRVTPRWTDYLARDGSLMVLVDPQRLNVGVSERRPRRAGESTLGEDVDRRSRAGALRARDLAPFAGSYSIPSIRHHPEDLRDPRNDAVMSNVARSVSAAVTDGSGLTEIVFTGEAPPGRSGTSRPSTAIGAAEAGPSTTWRPGPVALAVAGSPAVVAASGGDGDGAEEAEPKSPPTHGWWSSAMRTSPPTS